MTEDIAERLETILRYKIALDTIKMYKYTFADDSYFYNICLQTEKMLIDDIDQQVSIVKEYKDAHA